MTLPHDFNQLGPLSQAAGGDLLAAAGLHGWTFLRGGHNALHASPDGTAIAKVYGEASRCRTDVLGATAAREAGVRSVRLLELVHPRVAVWERIAHEGGLPSAAALERLASDVRRFAEIDPSLAQAQWLDHVAERAMRLDGADDEDVRWLAAELRAVAAAEITRSAPLAFQHGDLSTANLLHAGDALHIIDFETLRAAPREWDIACLHVSTTRYGTWSPDAFRHFVDALDPAPDQDLLELCIRLKELLNTSWLHLMREQHPEMVHELRTRVRSVRDGVEVRWRELADLAGVSDPAVAR